MSALHLPRANHGPVQMHDGGGVGVAGRLPERKAALAESEPTIEEKIATLFADVPESEWARVPLDLCDNLDHYIYGTPKR